MAKSNDGAIRVIVAADFTDEIMQRLSSISERLQVERHFPNVPDSAYQNVEVMYTIRHFPTRAQAPNLRWIQVHYAGVDGALDRPILQNKEVTLTSASGIHAVQMSEYTLAMMLHFMYKIPKLMSLQAESKWLENPREVFKPHGLRGLTLGIVGYGSIGRELARLADALGMTVVATKRDVMHPAEEHAYTEPGTGDPAGDIPERLYPPQALGTMVEECDYVVITVPHTEQTHHMVNKAILHRMKKTAVLINIARGGVVDEDALADALKSKRIGGAALDVTEQEPLPASSPLWKLDNVIISPHVSGNTSRYHEKAADLFIENLQRYLEGGPLLNVVKRDLGY